jgi:hypothetical protein
MRRPHVAQALVEIHGALEPSTRRVSAFDRDAANRSALEEHDRVVALQLDPNVVPIARKKPSGSPGQ